jgi:hypothetical protein
MALLLVYGINQKNNQHDKPTNDDGASFFGHPEFIHHLVTLALVDDNTILHYITLCGLLLLLAKF